MEDQNQRELRHADQRDGSARTPLHSNELTDEESASVAAWNKRKPKKDLGEVPPEKQHTRIP